MSHHFSIERKFFIILFASIYNFNCQSFDSIYIPGTSTSCMGNKCTTKTTTCNGSACKRVTCTNGQCFTTYNDAFVAKYPAIAARNTSSNQSNGGSISLKRSTKPSIPMECEQSGGGTSSGCRIARSVQDARERLNVQAAPLIFCIKMDERDNVSLYNEGSYGCAVIVMSGNWPTLQKALNENACENPRQITPWKKYIRHYVEISTYRSSPQKSVFVSGAYFNCNSSPFMQINRNISRLDYVRQNFKKL